MLTIVYTKSSLVYYLIDLCVFLVEHKVKSTSKLFDVSHYQWLEFWRFAELHISDSWRLTCKGQVCAQRDKLFTAIQLRIKSPPTVG